MALPRFIWPRSIKGRVFAVVAGVPIIAVVAYLFSALLVLDFTNPASPNDEEDYNGLPVAFGPEPRLLFCRPARLDVPGGSSFNGEEWALRFYRPICDYWRDQNGYAAPWKWRHEKR